ncbi:MAG: acetyltransferase [Gemmatimonadetes bacterium]|nr:acetyltransferase [Gemmatimonadota bacterium]
MRTPRALSRPEGPCSIVIVGAGALARDSISVFDAVCRAGAPWRLLGFLDEREQLWGERYFDLPVLGPLSWLDRAPAGAHIFIGVGDPAARRRLAADVAARGLPFCTVVHPGVEASPWVRIGTGCIIFAGCTLTVEVELGEHVVVNPQCSLAHDVCVGAYSYISPGVDLAGKVRLEEEVFMGTGAAVIPGRRIGRGAVIGAGAVVIDDIPPGVTAVGVPARAVKPEGGRVERS